MTKGRTSERGAALLLVLGGLAMISTLAAMALSSSTGPAVRANAAISQAQAERSTEAALHRLIAAVARDELRLAAPLDGTVISTDFFDAKIDFAGQDIGGLIDVNQADEATLARLLAQSGAANSAAIARKWIDDRTADTSSTARRTYRDPEDAIAALPIALRDEGRLVLPHLTVRSGQPTIDPYLATAPALAAAANIDLATAQGFVAARALDGRQTPLPEGADTSAFGFSESRILRIAVRATHGDGGRASLSAVVRVGRSSRVPITILSWR